MTDNRDPAVRDLRIGVDVGGTNTKIALVAADGAILRQAGIPTGTHGDPAPFLGQLAEVLGELVGAGPRGIGMALPGFFAPDGRSIVFNPNTPALVGIDFVGWLGQFGLPVRLEQDLNGPALAEYAFGAGRGARRLMTAPIGTGLGAAVMVDGELLRFTFNSAGDTGHVILQPGGPRCTAGCSGCAEALIAAPAVERAALEALDDPRAAALRAACHDGRIPARAVIAAARAGDPLANEIMRQIGRWCGLVARLAHADLYARAGGPGWRRGRGRRGPTRRLPPALRRAGRAGLRPVRDQREPVRRPGRRDRRGDAVP